MTLDLTVSTYLWVRVNPSSSSICKICMVLQSDSFRYPSWSKTCEILCLKKNLGANFLSKFPELWDSEYFNFYLTTFPDMSDKADYDNSADNAPSVALMVFAPVVECDIVLYLSKKYDYLSWRLSFLEIFWDIRAPFSAEPLFATWYGADVTSTMPFLSWTHEHQTFVKKSSLWQSFVAVYVLRKTFNVSKIVQLVIMVGMMWAFKVMTALN